MSIGRDNSVGKKHRSRVNEGIKAESVMLVGHDSEVVGVVSIREALALAREAGLDLVEVSPDSDPPVCKILDHGKLKYDSQKKKSQMRKKQKSVVIKEVKLRPGIDSGDYQIKLKRISEFIHSRFKVKVVMRLRGREIMHKDKSISVMKNIVEELRDFAVLDGGYNSEGHSVIITLAPKSYNG